MRSFRLGTTSFVYRAGWSENVRRLVGRVQDVELLCFEANAPDDLPTTREVAELRALRDAHGLTYSVHTPLSASLASSDDARRREGVDSVLRVMEATGALAPDAYVLHVYLGEREHDTGCHAEVAAWLDAWRERASQSLEEILSRSGVPARDLCVESLDYDLALLEPVLARHGVSLVLDIGHLYRDEPGSNAAASGPAPALRACIERYLPRTRIVQWHGTDPNDRDHRSLAHYPAKDARWLLRTLIERRFSGALTLELFREDDFETSLSLVNGWLAELGA
ncbi:MAG TPA: cobamide remodeling phosphodiesterase CbiR [Polyangiales bacterium]|jgi:sugar phosphate isomerase/epimerase|nr:cobamide remodeling phosphodiesterase CbiR [Polyangiales bacterium]